MSNADKIYRNDKCINNVAFGFVYVFIFICNFNGIADFLNFALRPFNALVRKNTNQPNEVGKQLVLRVEPPEDRTELHINRLLLCTVHNEFVRKTKSKTIRELRTT